MGGSCTHRFPINRLNSSNNFVPQKYLPLRPTTQVTLWVLHNWHGRPKIAINLRGLCGFLRDASNPMLQRSQKKTGTTKNIAETGGMSISARPTVGMRLSASLAPGHRPRPRHLPWGASPHHRPPRHQPAACPSLNLKYTEDTTTSNGIPKRLTNMFLWRRCRICHRIYVTQTKCDSSRRLKPKNVF